MRHEVVHNRFVVDDLKHRGAVFVEELDEVPDNATVIFSAHGVSQAVRQEAARRGLKVFDATCPLVTKVHLEVARQCRAGRDMVLIGHAGHPEVEGTMGQWSAQAGGGSIYLVEDIDDVATLDSRPARQLRLHHADHALGRRHAQHHRGLARALSGDPGPEATTTSATPRRTARTPCANSRRRPATSCSSSVRPTAPIPTACASSPSARASKRTSSTAPSEIDPRWVVGRRHIGVTAGASAPDVLVRGVIARLRELGAGGVRELDGKPEDMVFALPKELRLTWWIDPAGV